MLRIAKLTDYATVLMVRLARDPARCFSAAQLADELGVPLPTVAKLLKSLVQARLLTSARGAGRCLEETHSRSTQGAGFEQRLA